MLKINDILAFILELISLFLLASWAYSLPKQVWMKILLALASIVVFAIVWGSFFAPSARKPLSGILRWTLEFLVLFLPYLQFINKNQKILIVGGILIFINLFIQANYGRASW